MKTVLILLIDVFICVLLNYWGFLILQKSAGLSPSAGVAEIFWIFNTILLLGYLMVSYSVPTLVLSIFHFVFLIASVLYYSNLMLLISILIQLLLFRLFMLFAKQKGAHKLKPIVFVVLFIWLIVARSLV